MKKLRKKRTIIKKYGLYASHTDLKGVTETRQISTIETRDGMDEANRTGANLSKMLGMTFLHASEVTK